MSIMLLGEKGEQPSSPFPAAFYPAKRTGHPKEVGHICSRQPKPSVPYGPVLSALALTIAPPENDHAVIKYVGVHHRGRLSQTKMHQGGNQQARTTLPHRKAS